MLACTALGGAHEDDVARVGAAAARRPALRVAAARLQLALWTELRASGATFTGAVCMNLLRHPAWGRAQETYGEDPHHVGEMGAALTRGIQRHAMATVKHFAANSMENARFKVDIEVASLTNFIGNQIARPYGIKLIDRDVMGPSGPSGVYFELAVLSAAAQSSWTEVSVTIDDPTSTTLPRRARRRRSESPTIPSKSSQSATRNRKSATSAPS